MADYAGFWPRAGAVLIDWLIVFVVTTPITILFFDAATIPFLPLLVAAAIFGFWRGYGATPGKIAFGLRIVDAKDGGRPSTTQLVLRLVAYVLSALPLYLGFFWIAFDRRKQGWHDKIAKTLVIHEID